MIGYIKGTLDDAGEDYIILDNNGIGYIIGMPINDIEKVKEIKTNIKVFTLQHVREDNISLFGFLSKDKLNLFKLLLGVSGVGPKAALSIISSTEPQWLIMAIISSDEKTLCKAQGVGKKLAQRIILELKDKFKNYNIGSELPILDDSISEEMEAVGALMALGYSRQEALGAIKNLDPALSLEDSIKQALKSLMRG
jgi:Holliday junction DNA helicase RuvA